MAKETATGKTGKDRKERNLASSWDRIARDCQHHGSSSIPLFHSFSEHRWWGSPRRLVTWPFIRCSGRLFLRQRHISHMPPVLCMCFFSVLVPAGQTGFWCLDTFSAVMYWSSNSLRGWFWVVVYSLSGLYLAGPPEGPAASWVANKLWGNCLEIRSLTAF